MWQRYRSQCVISSLSQLCICKKRSICDMWFHVKWKGRGNFQKFKVPCIEHVTRLPWLTHTVSTIAGYIIVSTAVKPYTTASLRISTSSEGQIRQYLIMYKGNLEKEDVIEARFLVQEIQQSTDQLLGYPWQLRIEMQNSYMFEVYSNFAGISQKSLLEEVKYCSTFCKKF